MRQRRLHACQTSGQRGPQPVILILELDGRLALRPVRFAPTFSALIPGWAIRT